MPSQPNSAEKPVRVAFISSLPHSGSTVLDLTLSAHPQLVGLGEVAVFFAFYLSEPEVLESKVCTCGEAYQSCPFWSRVRSVFEAQQPPDDRVCYRLLLDCFRSEFGPSAVMVDSSKRRKHLTDLRQTDADVRVLALIRDVRSWVVSRRRLESTLSTVSLMRDRGLRGFNERLRLTVPWLFFRWLRLNRALDETRQQLECDGLRVGYEQFATAPPRILDGIWKFLDVEPVHNVQALEPTTHMLFGNKMRDDRSLRNGIFYDTRWMSDSSWHLASTWLAPVMRYNSREVYSDGQLLPFGPNKHLHLVNRQDEAGRQ